MTSDKSGPVRTATPELDEDLDTTRDRNDVTGKKSVAETSDPKPAETGPAKGSAPSAPKKPAAADEKADGAAAKDAAPVEPSTVAAPPAAPAASSSPSAKGGASSAKPTDPKPTPEPSAPAAPGEPATAVPTTGGIWRSAYEAGRPGKEPAPEKPAAGEAKPAPPSLVSAIGRVTGKADAAAPASAAKEPDTNAKSWNRVPAPDAPPAPPAPQPAAAEGGEGVRAGAMKAAQAALDAARSAAKKVSSIRPDDDERTVASPADAGARPEMHYTAAGVRGTATPAAAGAAAAGASAQVPQTPSQPASVPTPEVRPAPAGPRRVRLAISRVDPWSVMKLAFLLAVAIAIMTVVATAVFWSVLDSLSVFTTVQKFVEDAVGPQSNVNLTQFVEFPRVISLATLISICNIVLLTAIATIMAFLYNITAALVGGVHMTLTDD